VDLARETGALRPEGSALNALGVSLAALGDVEAGSEALRRAEQIARDTGNPSDLARSAVNLSDVLHLAGRTPEAIAVVEDTLAEGPKLGHHATWLQISEAEFKIDTGRWPDASARLAEVGRRHQGTTLLNALLRFAELALGRGEDAAAGEHLDRARRGAKDSREPQFIAVLHALLAEHAARSGDLPAAREAIEEGLDRIEFCTEDVHRIARLAAVGVRVEADIAQRARDLGDAGEADDATRRAAALLERVAVADDDDVADRPVEHAHWLTASAEQGRAAGLIEPALWSRAAAAWDRLSRPYAAAQARWRAAEARVLSGDREGAAATALEALATAERLGADWLAAELRALIARARLRPAHDGRDGGGDDTAFAVPAADADPFGLTDRERQVLVLVAGGSTNREIGARLYMAEKTASVHVSRILAKLDVRSRTEAAAVAHRLGLAGERAGDSA
jgi:ATP/maltotriose-dependent transcriptional regulator MalT